MTDAGEWLISTAKRNPEALLVLVAGCALLMRGGGSSYRVAEQTGSGVSGSNAPWNVSRTTETEKASEIVSELKDRIADAGSAVTEHAGDMVRTVSTQTSRVAGQAQSMFSSGFGQLLREQPLALVAAGLAAGKSNRIEVCRSAQVALRVDHLLRSDHECLDVCPVLEL